VEKLPRSVIDALAGLAPSLTFAAGEVVYREGDPAEGGLLVVTGRLLASVARPEGPHPLGESTPGDVVGEAGIFLRRGSRRATVIAAEPSVCLTLDRGLFRGRAGHDAICRLELHLLHLLAERIAATDAQVVAAWRETGGRSDLDARLLTILGGAR
jgi:CRP-like cAMP-binding protein